MNEFETAAEGEISPVKDSSRENSKRELFFIFSVFLALWLVFFYQIFEGRVLCGGDLINHYIPHKYFFKTWLLKGILPLWNPQIFCGRPFQADIQNGVFYPPNLLCLLMPLPLFYTVITILHLWFGTCGAYLLSGLFFRRGAPRFLFSFVFGFSSFFTARLYSGVVLYVFTASWIPWILYLAEVWSQRRTIGTSVLMGILLALQLLSGSPQIAYYTWILLIILFLLHMQRGDKRNHLWTGYALAGVIMVGLAAVQFIPMKELVANSYERASGARWDYVTDGSLNPKELLTFLAPGFFGDIRDEALCWATPGYWEYNGYVGIAPLFLVVLFFLLRRFRKTSQDVLYEKTEKRWNRFSLILLILWAVLAFGRYSPVFKIFYYIVPGFNRFRQPARMVLFYIIAISYLSSAALERLINYDLSHEQEGGRYGRWTFVAISSAIIIILVLLVLIIIRPYTFMKLVGVEHYFPEKVLGDTTGILRNITSPAQRSLIRFGILLAVAWGFSSFFFTRWFGEKKRYAVGGMLCVTIADLFLFGIPMIESVPTREFNERIYPETPLSYLVQEAARSNQRIAWTDSMIDWRFDQNQMELYPNRGMMKGIYDVRGYDPVIIRRYVELFNVISNFSSEETPGGFLRLVTIQNPALLDILNVRYVLTYGEQILPHWKLISQFPFGIRVYESQKVLGSAFLARSLTVSEKNLFLIPYILAERGFALDRIALMPDNNPARVSSSPVREVREEVRLISFTPNRREYEVVAGNSDILVFSENYYPGWRAEIDGRRVLPHVVDHALWGVFITPGTHKVVCYFRPWSFIIGGILSLCTLLALLIFLIYKLR